MKTMIIFITAILLSPLILKAERVSSDALLSDLQISENGGNLFGASDFGKNDLAVFDESFNFLNREREIFRTQQCVVKASQRVFVPSLFRDTIINPGDAFAVRSVNHYDNYKFEMILANVYQNPYIIHIDCNGTTRDEFNALTVGDLESMLENKIYFIR